MRTYLVTFVLSLLGAAALTPAVRRLAHSVGAIDRALSSRRVHTGPIPRLGGVAIVLAFYLPLVGLLLFDGAIAQAFKADRRLVIGLFVGGLAIVGLGLYDDLRGANAWKKFVVQFGVAGLMYALGFRIQDISLPFGGELHLGWAGLPVTLLWIVGIVNAMNLIDGLDGLAGGVAFFAVLTCFAISYFRGQELLIVFTAALGGAILGFLIYNFNPATIFMGDTGSMFLGFVLAVTSMRSSQKGATTVAVLVPIVALGLPLMDTALAFARRLVRGQSPFAADKDHIHHRLLRLGFSQRSATLLLYGFCIALGLAAFSMTLTRGRETGIILGVLVVVVAVFVRWLGYGAMRMAEWRKSLEQRRRNRERQREVRLASESLDLVSSREEAFQTVARLAGSLDASGVKLVTLDGDVLAKGVVPPSERPETVCCRVLLGDPRDPVGHLAVAWQDGRDEIDRDDEIALETIAPALTTALRRTERPDARSAKVIPLR
jgi:UDP-GlcNAc:undecaprenyl-phosphate GlcNAc-1-phosphate transferase